MAESNGRSEDLAELVKQGNREALVELYQRCRAEFERRASYRHRVFGLPKWLEPGGHVTLFFAKLQPLLRPFQARGPGSLRAFLRDVFDGRVGDEGKHHGAAKRDPRSEQPTRRIDPHDSRQWEPQGAEPTPSTRAANAELLARVRAAFDAEALDILFEDLRGVPLKAIAAEHRLEISAVKQIRNAARYALWRLKRACASRRDDAR